MKKFTFIKARCGFAKGREIKQTDVAPGVLETLIQFGAIVPSAEYKKISAQEEKAHSENLLAAAARVKPKASQPVTPDTSEDDNELDTETNDEPIGDTSDTGGSEGSHSD